MADAAAARQALMDIINDPNRAEFHEEAKRRLAKYGGAPKQEAAAPEGSSSGIPGMPAPEPVRDSDLKYDVPLAQIPGRGAIRAEVPGDRRWAANDPRNEVFQRADDRIAQVQGGAAGLAAGMGAGAVVSKGVRAIAGPLMEELPGALGFAARNVVAPAVEGGTSGAAANAASSTVQGKTPGEIAADAIDGAKWGGALGLAGNAVAGLGGAAVEKLTSPKTKVGRNNLALDATKDYRKTPEYKALPEGEAGVDQLAFQEGKTIADQATNTKQMGRALHEGAVDEILSSKGRVDPAPLHAAIDELDLANHNAENGAVRNPALKKRLAYALKQLTPAPGNKDLSLESVYQVRDTLKNSFAKTNGAPTPQQLADQEIYHAIKDALEATDSRIGPLNEMATEQIGSRQRASDLITKNADVTTSDAASTGTRMQSGMKKLGTAQGIGAAGADAAELGGIDDAYAEALRKIAGKSADVNTRPGLAPTWRGLLEKNVTGFGGRLALPLARGVSGAANAAPWLPGFLGNNIEDDFQAARERIKQRQALEGTRR